MNNKTTLGVSSKGNTKALCMCLASVLTGKTKPARIQVRLEGEQPGFNEFYLEQITDLARFFGVTVLIAVAKSTGVRDSRDWQLTTCKTPYLWMVDDDVILDSECLQAYVRACDEPATETASYLAGSKIDVNNRRDYPRFSMTPHGREDVKEFANANHVWDIEKCWGKIAPTQSLDTGNVLFDIDSIRKAGCTFRQFPDQANPSGDATTFSLVLDKAGLKGIFVPSARAYHLEKPGKGFNEFEARREMLLRTSDVKGFNKDILDKYFMP
jgi:hypothetical protein